MIDCGVILLSGIPCSGKTTLSKILKTIFTARLKTNCRIISPDKIERLLMRFTGKTSFDPELWKLARKTAIKLLENILALKFSHFNLLIFDDNNHYSSMRNQIKLICQKCPFLSFFSFI